jgi:Mrp family chromosome partitioning ATPase
MKSTTLARAARRHWWVVCAGLLAGVAGGAAAFVAATPVYAAYATVLVDPVGSGELNLNTEAQLARSSDTATAAAARLGQPDAAGSAMVESVRVEPLPGTSILIIAFEAPTPPAAQSGAQAFAEAYLANRADAAQRAIDDQVDALSQRIIEFEDELAGLNGRIGRLAPDSPELPGLRSAASTLTDQITTLVTRVNELTTTTVHPGRVIRQADLPATPVRPDAWLYYTAGAALGVLLGVTGAAARDRLSRRLRHAVDVTRRLGLPLLAQLPGDGTEVGILSPRDPGGRAFNRLRNEVVATLAAADRILLVTAANPGSASTIVAANLAAALARADNEVVLVGANVPEIGAEALVLSQTFDVGDIPGLTDVLAGRASLSRAVQRAPRTPRLRIVTPGGTASAAGLLQCEAARGVLLQLCRRARYVVVDAPSPAAGADAQSLAGAADAAILVAETGRATYADITDAAVQLRLVGTRLLGAVVLPRVLPHATAETGHGPPHRPPRRTAAADEWLPDNVRASIDPPTAVLHQLREQGRTSALTANPGSSSAAGGGSNDAKAGAHPGSAGNQVNADRANPAATGAAPAEPGRDERRGQDEPGDTAAPHQGTGDSAQCGGPHTGAGPAT